MFLLAIWTTVGLYIILMGVIAILTALWYCVKLRREAYGMCLDDRWTAQKCAPYLLRQNTCVIRRLNSIERGLVMQGPRVIC